MEEVHGVSWDQLELLEPRIAVLLARVRAVRPSIKDEWDEERCWNRFKKPIADIVGYLGENRGHPVLGTTEAYDVVYWRLHNTLVGDSE